MEKSQDNIIMARFIAQAIGFEPNVYPYYDDDRSHQIDILSLKDPLDQNVSIYSSIGLSDYQNLIKFGEGKQNVAIELLSAAYKKFDKVPNILSTCCFFIIKDKYECRPGTVFMRLIEYYYKNSAMKHIFFTTPFLWQEKLDQLKLEHKKVLFLLCIPISDQELQYKIDNGDEALETLLQERNIDIFDIERSSVI